VAEPAGRVNDRGRENDAAFVEIIAESPPAIQVLARTVRDLIYDVLPQRSKSSGCGRAPLDGGPARRSSRSNSLTSCPSSGTSRSASTTVAS
jgi:hypothetical protein